MDEAVTTSPLVIFQERGGFTGPYPATLLGDNCSDLSGKDGSRKDTKSGKDIKRTLPLLESG